MAKKKQSKKSAPVTVKIWHPFEGKREVTPSRANQIMDVDGSQWTYYKGQGLKTESNAHIEGSDSGITKESNGE